MLKIRGKNEIFLKIQIFKEQFGFRFLKCKIETNSNNPEQLAVIKLLIDETSGDFVEKRRKVIYAMLVSVVLHFYSLLAIYKYRNTIQNLLF